MTGRRRLRLRPLGLRYLLPTRQEAAERYVSPPPADDDAGPLEFGVSVPPERAGSMALGPMLTAGEAMAVHGDHRDRLDLWRRRHPASADVHAGVHQAEAGVVPMHQTYTLEGEDDER